jgi:glycerol uptake facilitator-like aquaporin
MTRLARSALIEGIATAAIVLLGVGASALVAADRLDTVGLGLVSGLALAGILEASTRVSRGFANPAVTVALWVGGRLRGMAAGVAVAGQLAGAALGAVLARFVLPGGTFVRAGGGVPAVGPEVSAGAAIVLEAVLSLVLTMIVVGAALGPDDRARPGGGFAVGAFVAAATIAFAPWTGAVMNPARWFGPALVSGDWTDWYVWTLGPLAGAALGAVLGALVFHRDQDPLP